MDSRKLIHLFLCLAIIVGCEQKESLTKRTATYYVSPNGSPSSSGLNPDSPLNSIKDAISKKDIRRVIIKKGVYRNCNNPIYLNAPSNPPTH